MSRIQRTSPQVPQTNTPIMGPSKETKDRSQITLRNKHARKPDPDLNESTSEGMLALVQNLMKSMFDEFEAR